LISSQHTTSVKPALTWCSMSSWTSAIASASLAVGCGPRSMARSIASRLHSAPQSTATPLSQLASLLPNGWDNTARADTCSRDITLLFDLPLCLFIGVCSEVTGSSADGPARLFRCASAMVSKCSRTVAEYCWRCWALRSLAASTRALAASLAGAILGGGFRGAVLSMGLPGSR
jgi:hypothetical protein